MSTIAVYVVLGLLSFIAIELLIVIQKLNRLISSEKQFAPQPGHTVNVNIDRDVADGERSRPSGEAQPPALQEPEREGESAVAEGEERRPDEPSEEQMLRRIEREQLATDLKSRNDQKRGYEDSRSSKAADRSGYPSQVIKCPSCGAENMAMRQNCFNCDTAL